MAMDSIESFTKILHSYESDIAILKERIDRAGNQIKTLTLIDECEEDIQTCFTQLKGIKNHSKQNEAFVDRKAFISYKMKTIEDRLDGKRRVIDGIKPI